MKTLKDYVEQEIAQDKGAPAPTHQEALQERMRFLRSQIEELVTLPGKWKVIARGHAGADYASDSVFLYNDDRLVLHLRHAECLHLVVYHPDKHRTFEDVVAVYTNLDNLFQNIAPYLANWVKAK